MNAFPTDRVFRFRWKVGREEVLKRLGLQLLSLSIHLDRFTRVTESFMQALSELYFQLPIYLTRLDSRLNGLNGGVHRALSPNGPIVKKKWGRKVQQCALCAVPCWHNECHCSQLICRSSTLWIQHILVCKYGKRMFAAEGKTEHDRREIAHALLMWMSEDQIGRLEIPQRLREFTTSIWFDGWELSECEEVVRSFFLEEDDYLPHMAAIDTVWIDPPTNTVNVPCRRMDRHFCNHVGCLTVLGYKLDGSLEELD